MSGPTPVGSEFLVNTSTISSQEDPDVTQLANGNFVVTWNDFGGDGDGSAVRGQIYQPDGTAVGGEFLVNTTIASNQFDPAVTALANGDFVVTWTDFSAGRTIVVGQVFQPDGSKSGSEFSISNTITGFQSDPDIQALANGNFVVAWNDVSGTGGDPSQGAVVARLYQPDGTAIGSQFLVNTTTDGKQSLPSIASLDNGGFVVTWADDNPGGGDLSVSAIRAQVYQADGTAVGGEFLVNTTTDLEQNRPAITGLADGGFVAVWDDRSESGGDTSGRAIRGQVFEADGTPSGAEFLVNTTTIQDQATPAIAALDTGGFVVTWNDASLTGADTSFAAVRGQLFDADGTKAGDEFLVNTTVTGNQLTSSIAALDGGDFVVTWEDGSLTGADTSSFGVRAQIFTTTNPVSGTPLADTLTGTVGADRILGLAGDDTLYGGDGVDVISGGTGDDFIRGDGPASGSDAGDGDDTILAGDGDDTVGGNGGNDLISGGAGADGLWGADGDDSLSGDAGDDQLVGGNGLDSLVGGSGDDTLSGGIGNDTLTGGDDRDTLYGGDGADLISGGTGDDFIRGDGPASGSDAGDGDDTILAGIGNDTVGGNGGDDLISGGAGVDRLWGADGNDTLFGGSGDDELFGGAGLNTFAVEGTGYGNDRLADFDAGEDLIDLRALNLLAGDLDSSGDGLVSSADAAGSTDTNGDLVIDAGGGSLTLVGVQSVSLTDILI